MAVYTKLSEIELKEFFSKYSLGKLLKHEEIKEGIVNTNYFNLASKGKYILTLYEKRIDEKKLLLICFLFHLFSCLLSLFLFVFLFFLILFV